MLSVALIALSLRLLHPGLPALARDRYAAEVHGAALRGGIPALLIVALAEHESHWRPGLVGGRDGACVGLGQVCLHVQPQCKDGFSTPQCLQRRAALQDAGTNLRWMGGAFASWRKLCRKRLGREPLSAELLSGYGGYDAARGTVCGNKLERRRGQRPRWVRALHPGVLDILRIQRRLEREVGRRRTSR
jgi:hypothetical protein